MLCIYRFNKILGSGNFGEVYEGVWDVKEVNWKSP